MHQNKNSNASAFSALDKSYDKLGKVFNFRWCKIDMNRMYEKKHNTKHVLPILAAWGWQITLNIWILHEFISLEYNLIWWNSCLI